MLRNPLPPLLGPTSRKNEKNPTPAANLPARVFALADVAQLVEHHLAKVRVAGSNLVIRSEYERPRVKLWGVRHFLVITP